MVDLSIIVPFYNAQKYFAKCLDSILSQQNINLELVLVNDGSNDGSEVTAAEYAKKDSRVVLFNQTNKGTAAARNKGIELATGNYFLFVDADDYIAENSLSILITTALNNDVDILQTEIFIGNNSNPPKRWAIYSVNKPISGHDYFMLMTKKHSMRISPYMNVVKREFAASMSFRFDEEMTRKEDFVYFTKLMIMTKRVMNINYPYYYFLPNSATQSQIHRKNTLLQFHCYMLAYNKFSAFIKDEQLNSAIKNRLNWYLSTNVSYQKADELRQLPYSEFKFWKDFVKAHIFSNQGWLRPYVYKRWLKFILIDKKHVS